MNRILLLATLFAMVLVPFAQNADAGIFNGINRLRGRWFSDGYHVHSPPIYSPYELLESRARPKAKPTRGVQKPKTVVIEKSKKGVVNSTAPKAKKPKVAK